MTSLKLAKLPDRTPAKITVTVSAGLNRALRDYAAYQDMRHVSWDGIRPKLLKCFRAALRRLCETLFASLAA
ncbi:DUF2274 domain-containing protein, partial [Nitratireductor sp. XY-223]|uniref:DUF2274 domain-containing protein n=1 Tax=Nitratireductor sp. XY-223 TaxID=2561926 RepID=UPI0010AA57F0